jgi:trimethylamine--corrinoid protein Co-methyltransferase
MLEAINSHVPPEVGWCLDGLSKKVLEGNHEDVLDLLQNTGIKVENNERALEIFYSGGAEIERYADYGIVKIPPSIVEDCLNKAPKTAVLHGRTEGNAFELKPGKITFTTFGEMIQIIDPQCKEVRQTTQKDIGDITRLCDHFSEVAVTQRSVAALDKPLGTHPIFNAQSMLESTGKHILIGPINATNFKAIAKIAAAHVGGMSELANRPVFTTLTCPTSPFVLEENCADLIIESASLPGGGYVSSPVPLLGMSTPATLGGTVAVVTVDMLAGLVLGQLTRPGTRVILSNSGAMMDLRFMGSAYGSPEMSMISAAIGQIARFYGLPSHCSGIHSDSKMVDAQCGYESALGGLVTALAGVNIINGLGSLELGFTFDYAKFMLDIDAVNNIGVILKGMSMQDSERALDIIKEKGPGGEFISHPHTLEYMRQLSCPKLFDRRPRLNWQEIKPLDIVERAYDRARDVLNTHTPPPIDPRVKEEVDQIIQEYMAIHKENANKGNRYANS